MRLSILGIQGSGKGTQSKLLAEHLHLKRIGSGESLRKEIKKNTKDGKILAKYMNQGLMAPNKLVNKIISKEIPKDNFILDGFPRDHHQLKFADKEKIDKIIFLAIPKKVVYKRINLRRKLENRADDTSQALKERLKLFYKETPIILKHFKGKVIKVNGNQPIRIVLKDILKKLAKN